MHLILRSFSQTCRAVCAPPLTDLPSVRAGLLSVPLGASGPDCLPKAYPSRICAVQPWPGCYIASSPPQTGWCNRAYSSLPTQVFEHGALFTVLGHADDFSASDRFNGSISLMPVVGGCLKAGATDMLVMRGLRTTPSWFRIAFCIQRSALRSR